MKTLGALPGEAKRSGAKRRSKDNGPRATGISAARRPGGIPDASPLCSMGPEVSIDHKIILQFSDLPLLRGLNLNNAKSGR